MQEHYETFIKLSLQQCKKNDYSNKMKVKVHNASFKKMYLLQNKMKKYDCSEMLKKLLAHDDERVKINAASFCLDLRIFEELVANILLDISLRSEDPTLSFAAQMLLGKTDRRTD